MEPAKTSQSSFYNILVAPRYRILRHLILIIALIFVALNFAMPYVEYHVFGTGTLIIFLISVFSEYLIAAYFTIFYLVPKHLLLKKNLSFFTGLSITVALLLTTQYYSEITFCHLLDLPPDDIYSTDNKLLLIINACASFFVNFIAFIGGSVTILLKNWLTNDEKAAQLEKEQLHNEVQHLKEQINPGFMFQTLHFAGTLEATNPAEASDILMKLSRLLRYQLYDCNQNLVFLTSEITYIENYLALEKKYTPALKYEITTRGDLKTTLMPPLLFIPFVQFMVGRAKTGNLHKVLNIDFSTDYETIALTCTLAPGHGTRKKVSLQIPELAKVGKRLHILFNDTYQLNFYGHDTLNIHAVNLQLTAPTQ